VAVAVRSELLVKVLVVAVLVVIALMFLVRPVVATL
jgi:hypothetical protein